MDRILAVVLCIAVIVLAIFSLAYCGRATADDVADVTTVPTAEIAVEETTEYATEPTETEAPTEETTEPSVVLYDVPLDYELQLHIISEAIKHDIDPAIIFAMAYRESRYKTQAVGDSGSSLGLLQVQPKWHKKRMERLGCTDLLDPYQNVTVAVDYLAEQINRYGGSVAKGLTAYNKGHYAGKVTNYANKILAHAEKLNNERGQ